MEWTPWEKYDEKNALDTILRNHQSDLKRSSGHRRGLTTRADTAVMEQIEEQLEDVGAEVEMISAVEEDTLLEHAEINAEVEGDDPFNLDSKL